MPNNNILSSIFSNFMQIPLDNKLNDTLESLEFKATLAKIDNAIMQNIQKIDDLALRDAAHEFIESELIKIIGSNIQISNEAVIKNFKENHPGVLPHTVESVILDSVNLATNSILNTFSPQQKCIFAKVSDTNDMLRKYLNLHSKPIQPSDNYNMSPIVPPKISNPLVDIWNSILFLENNKTERKLSDLFVKTNFDRILISNADDVLHTHKSPKATRETYKKEQNSPYYIQTLDASTKEYTVPAAIRHYQTDIKNSSNLDEVFSSFISSTNKIFVITGVPGSGKSSLLSYLSNTILANNTNCFFIILSKITYKTNLLTSICSYLDIQPCELEGKILVLDGLDEMLTLDNGDIILANFINDVKNNYIHVKFFITMRENYVDLHNPNSKYLSYYKECIIINLKNFGLIQIIDFHKKYTGEMISHERLDALNSDIDVFGIPLILYIIYSLELDINKDSDKYKLYNKIFSTENGIYDKCNSGTGGYGTSGRHFSIEDKESFHQISQKIAFLMYKNNSLEVSRETISNAIQNCGYTDTSIRNYLYNNYYETNSMQIKFIHKSFYEYFLAEFLFNSIKTIFRDYDTLNEQCHYICNLLLSERINNEVFKHFQSKQKIDEFLRIDEFSIPFSQLVKKIILLGCMHFVTAENTKNILLDEATIFFNLMKLSSIILTNPTHKISWSEDLSIIDRELRNLDFFGYLEPHLLDCLAFTNTDCLSPDISSNISHSIIWVGRVLHSKALVYSNNLIGSYFISSRIYDLRLENLSLCKCDFRNCAIENVSFINSNLSETNFECCSFKNVSFIRATMDASIFLECTMENVTISEEYLSVLLQQKVNFHNLKIYLQNSRKTISYEKYLEGF